MGFNPNYQNYQRAQNQKGRTRFDADRADFSEQAHVTACRLVYPLFFGQPASNIRMVDCTLKGEGTNDLKTLDGSHGIDKVAYVTAEGYREPLIHTIAERIEAAHPIQERFQKPTNARQRNITITAWNGDSGKPSELYKIKAMWFVGGFFTDPPTSIIELVVCPWPTLCRAIHTGQVYSDYRQNDKGQPFLRVTFDEIRRKNLASLHLRGNEVLYNDADSALDDPFTSFVSSDDEDEPEAFGYTMPQILTTNADGTLEQYSPRAIK